MANIDPTDLKLEVTTAFQILDQSIGFETEAQQRRTLVQVEKLLHAIYRAAVTEVKYSPEDRELLGRYIPRALLGIGAFISHTTTYFPPHGSLGRSKIERSGLQFLLDELCAGEGVTVSVTAAVEEFKAIEDIQRWDNLLKGASFHVPFDIHEFDLPDEHLRMIPQHHFWLAVPFI